MMMLTRSEPAKNMHRFYALHLTPTLFGEWMLVAEWGGASAHPARCGNRPSPRWIWRKPH